MTRCNSGHGSLLSLVPRGETVSRPRGYRDVLGPMESASALFMEKVIEKGVPTSEPRYRNALYHLLLTGTSCFRYWGSGVWTDYARELCRRTRSILESDF